MKQGSSHSTEGRKASDVSRMRLDFVSHRVSLSLFLSLFACLLLSRRLSRAKAGAWFARSTVSAGHVSGICLREMCSPSLDLLSCLSRLSIPSSIS